MAERVAFSKTVKLEWLNEAAGYYIAGLSRREAGERLNDSIGRFISNGVNIKQTRIILLSTWYDTTPALRDAAAAVFFEANAEERRALHWALLLNKYPLFYDLVEMLGHLYAYRDTVALAQIRAQIYEKWGERATIESSLSKNMATLRELGAIAVPGKSGVYQRQTHAIRDPHVIGILFAAVLKAGSGKFLTWDALVNHPALFSFRFEDVSAADMAAIGLLRLERMDGRTVICPAES